MSETAIATDPATVASTPAPVTPNPDQAAADAIAANAATTTTTPAPVKAADPATTQTAAEVAYTLALPKDAAIEASAIERLTSFAKEHKLTPDAAQKALNLADAEVKADRVVQVEQAKETFKTMATKTWVEELKADPEFGGDKYIGTVTDIKRAADKFLTDGEREVMNTTGWGNHPMLCKMFARMGKAMANDTLVTGGSGGAPTPKNDAQVLYPNMNP